MKKYCATDKEMAEIYFKLFENCIKFKAEKKDTKKKK